LHEPNQYYYDAPTRWPPLIDIVMLGAIFALMIGLAAFDKLKPQFLGWALFPLEWALNLIFFPNATTYVRGNGSALCVLVLTLGAFYLVYLCLSLPCRFISRRIAARRR
jgi:hypothetical protein